MHIYICVYLDLFIYSYMVYNLNMHMYICVAATIIRNIVSMLNIALPFFMLTVAHTSPGFDEYGGYAHTIPLSLTTKPIRFVMSNLRPYTYIQLLVKLHQTIFVVEGKTTQLHSPNQKQKLTPHRSCCHFLWQTHRTSILTRDLSTGPVKIQICPSFNMALLSSPMTH